MSLFDSFPVPSFQYFHIEILQGKVCILFNLYQGYMNLWGKVLDLSTQMDSNNQHHISRSIRLQFSSNLSHPHFCNNNLQGNLTFSQCYLFQILSKFCLKDMPSNLILMYASFIYYKFREGMVMAKQNLLHNSYQADTIQYHLVYLL